MLSVDHDLQYLGLPTQSAPEEILDVAIIGAGQSGLGLALALQKHRIVNVALFDKEPRGKSHWNTTARMLIHRTPKHFPGPALEDEEDRFGEVAASQNLQNLTAGGIAHFVSFQMKEQL